MILGNGTILIILAPIILIFIIGAVRLVCPVDDGKGEKTHVIATMLMVVAAIAGIIVEKNTTSVSEAVDNIHRDAEIIEGEIESISFDPNTGITLTVDGDTVHITPHDDAKVPLKDNSRHTYGSIEPKIGDTLGYKEYTFRGEDYTYAVSYTKKNE